MRGDDEKQNDGGVSSHAVTLWHRCMTFTRILLYPVRSLCRCGIDDAAHLRDLVSREAALAGVFADQFFVGRDVHAIQLVIGDVTLDPLNRRSEVAENATRGLRNALELVFGQVAGLGDFAFNYVLRHIVSTRFNWERKFTANRTLSQVPQW